MLKKYTHNALIQYSDVTYVQHLRRKLPMPTNHILPHPMEHQVYDGPDAGEK